MSGKRVGGKEKSRPVVEEKEVQGQLQPLSHLQPAAQPGSKQLLGVERQWPNIKTADSSKQAASCPPLVQKAAQR